jgi:Transglycosylase-like domain
MPLKLPDTRSSLGALTAPFRQEGTQLPDFAGRRRAVSVAILAAAILASIIPAAATSTTAPPGLERFLFALGQVESAGNYEARNVSSGAYGKYQIMPANWPGWAKIYVGSSTAPQTPVNQERVAHGKVAALYNWLDTWPTVAHWWLTGSSERNQGAWSSYSRLYVSRIMRIYNAVTTVTISAETTKVVAIHIGQSSAAIKYAGGWSIARLGAYTAGRAKYSIRDRATASIEFTGRSISWKGPVGPTRGKARVYIDGVAVATIDLRRSSFKARATLFRKTWTTAGQHTLTIRVLGSGRPVAIDEFIVAT